MSSKTLKPDFHDAAGERSIDIAAKSIVADVMELERQGKLNEAALAEIDARVQEEFRQFEETQAKAVAAYEANRFVSKPAVLPKRFYVPAWGLFIFVFFGPVLEITIGEGFIFSYANDYRAAVPWIFWILVPILGIGFFIQEKKKRVLSAQYPTWVVRWLIMFPIMVTLGAGGVAMSPLGWFALAGWATGTGSSHLEAKVLSIGSLRPSSRGCDQQARLQVLNNEADICLEGRILGTSPKQGDTLAIAGRISGMGVYIEKLQAK
ncbi:hypothetical protein [Polaromonas sp.]|uniref:hypothetical protein n=1 Tax=Polaromonas sp. TaxID=1869339 RepID=UPI003266EAD4